MNKNILPLVLLLVILTLFSCYNSLEIFVDINGKLFVAKVESSNGYSLIEVLDDKQNHIVVVGNLITAYSNGFSIITESTDNNGHPVYSIIHNIDNSEYYYPLELNEDTFLHYSLQENYICVLPNEDL